MYKKTSVSGSFFRVLSISAGKLSSKQPKLHFADNFRILDTLGTLGSGSAVEISSF